MATKMRTAIPSEAISSYLAANPGAKRSDIATHVGELVGRDASTLWRYLQKLQADGLIRSEGMLKGTRYFLSVPRAAQPAIRQTVADIVRVGQTFALEPFSGDREFVYAAVRRELDRLTPETLPTYGLRTREYSRYLERTHARAGIPS